MDSFASRLPFPSETPASNNISDENNVLFNQDQQFPEYLASVLTPYANISNVENQPPLPDPNLIPTLTQPVFPQYLNQPPAFNQQAFPDPAALLLPFNPSTGFSERHVDTFAQEPDLDLMDLDSDPTQSASDNPLNLAESIIQNIRYPTEDQQPRFDQQSQVPESHDSTMHTQIQKENEYSPAVFPIGGTTAQQKDGHTGDKTTNFSLQDPTPSQKSGPTASQTGGERSGTTNDGERRGRKRKRTRTKDLDPSQVHTCPTCGKKFAKKYNQKIHQRRHQGDLPFVCEYDNCGKGFMWRSSFLRHLKTHESRTERPHKAMRRNGHPRDPRNAPSVDIMQISQNASIVLLNGIKINVDHHGLDSVNTAVSLCRLSGSTCNELLNMNIDVIREEDERSIASRYHYVENVKRAGLDFTNQHIAHLHQLVVADLLKDQSNEPPLT